MKIPFNSLNRGYQKYKEAYDQAAIATLESGWYILGERLKRFEQEFANFTNSTYCVGVNSGMDALILAFRALEIGQGDEVIVPANTYIASVLGITENGATPILVDVDDFYNLDASKLERNITEKTKAILVVHLYGQAANMAAIQKVAKKHDLFIVEDCAQSHGASFQGKKTGSFGDIGCFSYYPTKNIGAFGDSGSLVTDDKAIYEKLKMLRNYGSHVKYKNEILGINSRLDEIQAALLSVKLSHYDELRSERATIAKKYLEGIKNEQIHLPTIRKGAEHVWHLFVIQTEKRATLKDYLTSHGIGTQIHYPIPPHLSEAYREFGYTTGDFPVTEAYARTILSLPLYEGMTDEEIEYVIAQLNKYEG